MPPKLLPAVKTLQFRITLRVLFHIVDDLGAQRGCLITRDRVTYAFPDRDNESNCEIAEEHFGTRFELTCLETADGYTEFEQRQRKKPRIFKTDAEMTTAIETYQKGAKTRALKKAKAKPKKAARKKRAKKKAAVK